ncbi:hypothetical protein CHH28_14595 [Bacterioplanes sanyensis]|uniref:Type VI secretion protein n=1 Tax=Bacterioplanes sanyensis TaxID=1249553 RepID=A0A222FML9_9GAMM|nr:type VI secretion system baseplate subunit TssG [Bacterioplanes sanyensis]ASP39826.1 hypothetical protein CHH28_14595 [Bacterioplanes sanyensis]
MASAYWRTGHSVSTLLQSPGVGWDFLQLVRLLLTAANADEYDQPTVINDQALLQRLTEQVQFGLSLDADFPPGEVRHLDYQEHQPTELVPIHGGLIAPDGPLPEPFVEWLRELSEQGEEAMLQFLGLFNQRLLALRYLVNRDQSPTLIDTNAEQSHSGALLLALCGHDGHNQDVDHDLALAGLLANCRMSLPIIRHLLAFSLGLQLREMRSLEGGWVTIDDSDYTYLGEQHACVLGSNSVLGRQVWDQHKSIHLIIGPVDWPRLQQLVPGGEDHQQLVAVIQRITDCHFDCRISLFCPQVQIPDLKLGHMSAPMSLGLTAFLPISWQPSSDEFQHSLAGDEVEVSFMVESSL